MAGHFIGVPVTVEVVDPESLERSVGKIRRIVELRPRQGRRAGSAGPVGAGRRSRADRPLRQAC